MNKIVQIQNIIYQYAYIAINNGYVLVASLLSLIILPNHADTRPNGVPKDTACSAGAGHVQAKPVAAIIDRGWPLWWLKVPIGRETQRRGRGRSVEPISSQPPF